MDLGLSGRTAIVTGGNRGIGRCCALALAREGASVCIAARDRARLGQVAGEIAAVGGKGHGVAADLTASDACGKVVDECVGNFGGVDVLVNCAGAAQGGDVLSMSTALLEDALGLKTFSYLRMSQLVIPHMKRNGWGRIIMIAGGAGASPTRGNLPLSVSNVAILNMTRSLSDAVSADGIQVNAICPGLTNTQRARDLQQAAAAEQGVDTESILRRIGEGLPARRIAEPEEIAEVAAFLASERCSYLFGSSIYMDGGERRGTP